MYFNKTNDDPYEMNVVSYGQDIEINYKLMEGSNRKHTSIDRGDVTDRYATKLRFRGTPGYIGDLIYNLTRLRSNSKTVDIYDIPEDIFGDNVDHSAGLSCFILKMGKQQNVAFNVQSVDITFIIDMSTIIYKAGGSLPLGLKCLQHTWEGFSTWGTTVHESYNEDISFIDRDIDRYEFKGKYILSNTETGELMNWWRIQRGNEYIFDNTTLGITLDMFGPTFVGETSHPCIVGSIDYEYVSPILRSVTLTILRNGDEDV